MSQPWEPKPATTPRWTAGAVALIVIGLLIVIPSGLCTAVFAGGAGLLIPLLIGGPFIAVGISLIIAGWRSYKQG